MMEGDGGRRRRDKTKRGGPVRRTGWVVVGLLCVAGCGEPKSAPIDSAIAAFSAQVEAEWETQRARESIDAVIRLAGRDGIERDSSFRDGSHFFSARLTLADSLSVAILCSDARPAQLAVRTASQARSNPTPVARIGDATAPATSMGPRVLSAQVDRAGWASLAGGATVVVAYVDTAGRAVELKSPPLSTVLTTQDLALCR